MSATATATAVAVAVAIAQTQPRQQQTESVGGDDNEKRSNTNMTITFDDKGVPYIMMGLIFCWVSLITWNQHMLPSQCFVYHYLSRYKVIMLRKPKIDQGCFHMVQYLGVYHMLTLLSLTFESKSNHFIVPFLRVSISIDTHKVSHDQLEHQQVQHQTYTFHIQVAVCDKGLRTSTCNNNNNNNNNMNRDLDHFIQTFLKSIESNCARFIPYSASTCMKRNRDIHISYCNNENEIQRQQQHDSNDRDDRYELGSITVASHDIQSWLDITTI